MEKYLGWCPQLAERLNMQISCCTTCHEDDEQEYAYLSNIEFEDGYYDVCCKMRQTANGIGNRVDNGMD